MRRALFFLVCAVPLLLAAACGDDDDGLPAATGPAGSDEDYLRAVCIGTSNFSNALLSKTSAEEIAGVVRDFADEMKALNPRPTWRSTTRSSWRTWKPRWKSRHRW
ncbi:MAG: hypothetical protein M5U18_02540 [Dehalococcoidia bacterium]|nr:hypothetical protein [Dehalococcoidia bacterium]